MAPASKIPIYPRPVSPLSAESLYLEPQDIIYEPLQPSSDDDASARAAKRRRIARLGEQYLRGDGLHILSAGLQGPFNSKWKNPWGKRGQGTKRAVAEIPETASRPVKKLQARRYGRAKMRNSKVEEWLRRSSACSDLEIEEQSSPTPVHTKVVDIGVIKLAKLGSKVGTEDVMYGPSCSLDSESEIHKVVDQFDSRKHDAQCAARPRSSADRPHRYEADNTHIERRAWVSPAANADRAEVAALISNRRVVEGASVSTMLSPFKYRCVSDAVQKRRKFEEVGDQLQEKNKSMAPPATSQPYNPHAKDGNEGPIEFKRVHVVSDGADPAPAVIMSISSAIPPLSTDTSHDSVADLPSAQPQSLNVPAPSTNNLAFEEQAVERQIDPVDATEELLRNTKGEALKADRFNRHVNGRERKSTSEDNQTPHLKDKALCSVTQTRLPRTVAKVELVPDTQDMLAGMSPLTFSTVKRATSQMEPLATPVTATKRHPEKPSRTVSFAQGERFSSGSSQGSLKMSLRVSKGPLSVALGKENKLISVGKEELNEQFSGRFSQPAKERLLPVASLKGLISSLKPSGPPTRTLPFPSTKGSTSTGIDGGQNVPVLGEDVTFDLEGVMDSLGSYLETWDAEKEASTMRIDT